MKFQVLYKYNNKVSLPEVAIVVLLILLLVYSPNYVLETYFDVNREEVCGVNKCKIVNVMCI